MKEFERLSLASLSERQGALMLELLLINRELIKRFRVLVDLAKSSDEETKAVLGTGADCYEAINAMLEAELTSRLQKNSN